MDVISHFFSLYWNHITIEVASRSEQDMGSRRFTPVDVEKNGLRKYRLPWGLALVRKTDEVFHIIDEGGPVYRYTITKKDGIIHFNLEELPQAAKSEYAARSFSNTSCSTCGNSIKDCMGHASLISLPYGTKKY